MTTQRALIMSLRLISVQLNAMQTTSTYDLTSLRSLLRNVVALPEASSSPSADFVDLTQAMRETAANCFNAAVAMLYRDPLSRASLLMSVMGGSVESPVSLRQDSLGSPPTVVEETVMAGTFFDFFSFLSCVFGSIPNLLLFSSFFFTFFFVYTCLYRARYLSLFLFF